MGKVSIGMRSEGGLARQMARQMARGMGGGLG